MGTECDDLTCRECGELLIEEDEFVVETCTSCSGDTGWKGEEETEYFNNHRETD